MTRWTSSGSYAQVSMGTSRAIRENQLSEDEIVAAALRLTLRDGLDQLTMRGLAAELGVTPMAAYHYVPSKEALLVLVVTTVLADIKPLDPDHTPWDVELRRHAVSMWETLSRYHGVGQYIIGQPDISMTPGSMAHGIAFFRAAGFDERQATLANVLYNSYLFSRVSVQARLTGRKDVHRTSGLTAQDHFEFGIDTIIQGLRDRAQTPVD